MFARPQDELIRLEADGLEEVPERAPDVGPVHVTMPIDPVLSPFGRYGGGAGKREIGIHFHNSIIVSMFILSII
jgi:hypothetical protein